MLRANIKLKTVKKWSIKILEFFFIIYVNKIKKPNINENKAIASVKANPKIANLKSSSFKVGFPVSEYINEENTAPIPTPAPVSPAVAKPAPTF